MLLEAPIAMPITMPIGVVNMKRMKKAIVGLSRFGLCDSNVAPIVKANGILWMMTLRARMKIRASSSKTPIARPSIVLCRQTARPKVTSDSFDTRYTSFTAAVVDSNYIPSYFESFTSFSTCLIAYSSDWLAFSSIYFIADDALLSTSTLFAPMSENYSAGTDSE